jgi:hypothetical protein
MVDDTIFPPSQWYTMLSFLASLFPIGTLNKMMFSFASLLGLIFTIIIISLLPMEFDTCLAKTQPWLNQAILILHLQLLETMNPNTHTPDHEKQHPPSPPDPHISFFKSLTPSYPPYFLSADDHTSPFTEKAEAISSETP